MCAFLCVHVCVCVCVCVSVMYCHTFFNMCVRAERESVRGGGTTDFLAKLFFLFPDVITS